MYYGQLLTVAKFCQFGIRLVHHDSKVNQGSSIDDIEIWLRSGMYSKTIKYDYVTVKNKLGDSRQKLTVKRAGRP